MSDEDLREFVREELQRAMDSCRWYRKAWSTAHFTTGVGIIIAGGAATFISLYTKDLNWLVGLLSISVVSATSIQGFLRMEDKKKAFRDLNTGLQGLRRALIQAKEPVESIAQRLQEMNLEHNRAISASMRVETHEESIAGTATPQATPPSQSPPASS